MESNIEKVAKKMGLTKEKVKEWVLPPIGTTFDLLDIRYKVVYTKANPYSFSAVPLMPAPKEEEKND